MPTTRLMATVLPYSVDPADEFHVSVFISHRLEGGGQLSDYAPMVNWVQTLRAATITLHTAESATSIACHPLLNKASETAWQTAFPASTRVGPYPEPKPTDADWNSFPANKMPEHAIDVHQASALHSPIDRPRVGANPLAQGVLTSLSRAPKARDVISELQGYEEKRDGHRKDLEAARQNAAHAAAHPEAPAVDPVPPPPDPDPGPSGPHIGRSEPRDTAEAPQAWRSPIEILLDRADEDGIDADITALLDPLVKDPLSIGKDPILRMIVELHEAQQYYNRPPEPEPEDGVRAAPGAPEPPDFHARVASVCNVPALARKLGIVVDIKVDDLDALKLATAIWCDVDLDDDVTDFEKYLSPKTLCVAEGDRFLARAKDINRWTAGRLRLGDPQRYRVMDLDPDAGALSLEQLCRSAVRALAVELNGDPGSYAPAGLRSTGFAVAELKRSERLHEQVQDSEGRKVEVEQPGTPQTREEFHFEELLRGTRVEVWDDVTGKWHSLHERLVTASFTDTPILDAADDDGMLQNPPLSRTPGDPNNPYYVHEVLAGWDGWSLSAPKPGKHVIHNDAAHPEPGRERFEDAPESTAEPGLWVRSTVKPNTLPALRYGRKYSFRIAGVDLAGNSVPLDSDAPATAAQPLIDMAAAHLDALRAEASTREQSGVLHSLRGEIKPEVHDGTGTRAEIERATASVVDNAASLRRYPQWENVDLGHLAGLFADAGDPNVVTVPRLFLRWDPIPAPTLVPRADYTTGESVQRMVIRTGLQSGPGLCQRHIAAPKGSELEAEQDGRLDPLMQTRQFARAYAIALKERGTFYHKDIQDLNDPRRTVPQPGIRLVTGPNATDVVDLEDIQDPEEQPGAGQYIVHDVDQLTLPYLPDPMAHGVALVFYQAGADHRLSIPRVLQSVTVDYAGGWPEIQPLRLVLHGSETLDAQLEGNVIHVGLPPGEQVAVKYSTTLDAEHLAKMGPWRFHPVHDPMVPEADRRVLEAAARDGWMWWLTPDEDLRLVHATARPATPPRISRLLAEPRQPSVATAILDGVIDVHGSSTDKVELRAVWTDFVDDPAAGEPAHVTTSTIVTDYRIGEHERYSLLTSQGSPDPMGDVPIRPTVHALPDTKAHMVTYRLHGSSRYREFFTPEELPDANDELSAGNPFSVNVPSSAPPAPPVVHDVIPMFLWEQTTEPEHPFAMRRVRRSGVRIWLERPWNSSGDGEMLAVLAAADPGPVEGRPESVSLWARDPIVASPSLPNSYAVPLLSDWQQRAVRLALAPESLPGRPSRYVVKEPPPTDKPEDRDKIIQAYAYTPEFHPKRNMWFVDVVLDSRSAAWPFLRLAVARYQSNSISGMEFSEIVATDFIQIPPERIGTLSRPDGQNAADHPHRHRRGDQRARRHRAGARLTGRRCHTLGRTGQVARGDRHRTDAKPRVRL